MAVTNLLLASFSGVAFLICVRLVIRLMRYDRIEYEKSRSRYPSLWDAISGRAIVRVSDVPDSRVSELLPVSRTVA